MKIGATNINAFIGLIWKVEPVSSEGKSKSTPDGVYFGVFPICGIEHYIQLGDPSE